MIVVPTAMKQVTGKKPSAHFGNNLKIQIWELTQNAVDNGVADFLLILHVHLNGHQHGMDVELEGNHAVGFEEGRNAGKG